MGGATTTGRPNNISKIGSDSIIGFRLSLIQSQMLAAGGEAFPPLRLNLSFCSVFMHVFGIGKEAKCSTEIYCFHKHIS
jgi:hypothetical protein